MNANEIQSKLMHIGGYGNIFIPEYTWKQLRIDAIIIDIKTRWIRGFEIKTSRADFKQDDKWVMYSEFCSSLSIVCPEGLIQKNEVESPFGLLWVCETGTYYHPSDFRWIKRPKKIQHRNSLAWIWTYLNVIERELPRMYFEIDSYKREYATRLREVKP